MNGLGSELDAARARVVARGLTAEAVAQLTPVVSGLSLEALGPVKQLLKRFFSEQPWYEAEDDALADAVGAGSGEGRAELEPGLALVWGWEEGRFRLRVHRADPAGPPEHSPRSETETVSDLGETFDGVVVPEATPSPRTIRFATPRLHAEPSRSYDSTTAAGDARVARLFGDFDEVSNVLVGPDFVAVTISRPDRWEALLAPVLRAVSAEFTADTGGGQPVSEPPVTISRSAAIREASDRGPGRLERAWAELGGLRADRPEDLEHVLRAARDPETPRRQVAAVLLADAPREAAARAWAGLLDDPSRAVRRSTIDTLAGAGREDLRPLLERALADDDAWTRWKALRGIAALGAGPSRSAVEARAADHDFRVRLEAARLATDDRGQ